LNLSPIQAPIGIRIIVNAPDSRRRCIGTRCLDRIIKTTISAIAGAMLFDEYQIEHIEITRGKVLRDDGRLDISIWKFFEDEV